MRYLGIDIGKGGGIASIDGDDYYVAYDMPVYVVKKKHRNKPDSKKRHIDKLALWRLLQGLKTEEMICFIERNRPRPREGSISSFSLGEQVGLVQGYLIALGIPYQVIYPQTWYKHFGMKKESGSKNASYEKASSLFPRAVLKTERDRIIDGRADSLLIAEYGKRVYVTEARED